MTTRVFSAEELEVCEEVGRGGFGVVYRGLIKTTNEEVAIKQIDLENDHTDLFEINKEILIISECRLPQITKYLGCFVKNYKLWVIMEFVNGGSLFEILQPKPVKDETIILIIAKEILLALEYLHNQGKIHRDLKSQNILLSSKGDIKLTDFGVSTQLSSNFSRRNTTVGTPYWMAPEVILNDNGGHNSKADIWSLGCCLYELFNGKPPLQNQYPPMKALRYISKCVKDDDFLTIINLSELDISSNFKDFLVECFRVDTKKRFSASKLLKHKFIVKNTIDSTVKVKLIKSLITNKHLWDQENHIMKSQNFYLPTEIKQNQEKWRKDGSDEDKTIKFDISTLNEYPSPKSTTRESSISPSNTVVINETPNKLNHDKSNAEKRKDREKLHYQSLQQQDSKQKNLSKTLKPELNKILNKIFYKLDSKSNLSTEQYDLIVSLNQNIIDLLSFTNSNLNSKLVICQYLKYFIKELNKNDNDLRLLLRKLIIPSELKDIDTIKLKTKDIDNGPFDEIENSLFETWIDEMKHLK